MLNAADTLLKKIQCKPVKTGMGNFGIYVGDFVHYGKYFKEVNRKPSKPVQRDERTFGGDTYNLKQWELAK